MIYKYLGEVPDPKTSVMGPRASCLRDGLFRITQPALLNDKTSEFRAAVFFSKFSPADYAWARERERKFQLEPRYEPSNEELEQMFLKPTGVRYGEEMPHLWEHEKFRNMNEFDEARVEEVATLINGAVVGVFSTLFGVLSLCEDPSNKLMWTHYGSEGRGLAIGFDESHPFFSSAGLRRVSYEVSDRASITYFKGTVRFNGRPMLPDRDGNRFLALIKDPREFRAMMNRFVYAKEPIWSYEREQRLLVPLSQRDAEVISAGYFNPMLPGDLAARLESILPCEPKICLKRIPFAAFSEVLLGYEVSSDSERRVRELLEQNVALKHLVIKRMKVNAFGDLVAHPY